MPHSASWQSPTFIDSDPSLQPSLLQSSITSGICVPNDEDFSTAFDDLLEEASSEGNIHIAKKCSCVADDPTPLGHWRRRQSQHSGLRKIAMATLRENDEIRQHSSEGSSQASSSDEKEVKRLRNELDKTLSRNTANANGVSQKQFEASYATERPRPAPSGRHAMAAALNGNLGDAVREAQMIALNDTPATTAPSSPRIPPIRQGSGSSTPRVRPTTLDIPGLTKSKVSPDGRIAQRDLGAKLVIVMVGLPARGKSYITKKLARYLNWLQHDTKIFNVGERRRVAAGGPNTLEKTNSRELKFDGHRLSLPARPAGIVDHSALATSPRTERRMSVSVAQIILNGERRLEAPATPPTDHDREEEELAELEQKFPELLEAQKQAEENAEQNHEIQQLPESEVMDQSANFFDPANKKASLIREQVAMETLDELLDYILEGNGSIGILDATNSTLERRKMVMRHIRERAGPELNVLFLESRCLDQDLLEANMRLKLNGPDYKDTDPTIALEDFKKRVQVYEKAYVPLGDYEEAHNISYIQMIDVGRKIISHQIHGFLSAQANYYLLNFNLAPRQIWITRHGTSMDNISGKIGGDSDLAPEGQVYARCLARFMDEKRREWDLKQIENTRNTHFPPQPGDATPPNPHYQPQSPGSVSSVAASASAAAAAADISLQTEGYEPKNFCVWTSMLKRSIQTAQHFNDEDYDTKQMRMLDELNAGVMEGLTYSCISTQYPEEFRARKADKLHYRYPGPGGEGYLDIINRLRPVIVELERMTDHVLLVGHRSVARVLLSYFRGLNREEVADVDVPLGMLYCLEPKPYGVDFKAYKWDRKTEWFFEVPEFELRRAEDDMPDK